MRKLLAFLRRDRPLRPAKNESSEAFHKRVSDKIFAGVGASLARASRDAEAEREAEKAFAEMRANLTKASQAAAKNRPR
jgi:hypothetical protein